MTPGTSRRASGRPRCSWPRRTLVYNEQHEPAAQWFGDRCWRADATLLPDYLRSLNRPVPAADSEAGKMTGTISLVSATKR